MQKHGSAVAIVDDSGTQFTYADLHKWITNFGDCVASQFPRPLVFVHCNNSLASIVGYLACLTYRFPVLLLPETISVGKVTGLIDKYQPQAYWGTLALANSTTLKFTLQGFQLRIRAFKAQYDYHTDLALLLMTSGSTGHEKTVRLSYNNLDSNTNDICQTLRLSSNDRPITSLPINYTYGLSVINTYFNLGATILLTNKGVLEKAFWTFLNEHQATSLSGVPYTYFMLDRLRILKQKSSLQKLTQAGGKLDPSLAAKIGSVAQSNGMSFHMMYGQTEATARISAFSYNDYPHKVNTIGRPIINGKMDIVDSEIIYEGKNVMMGYAYSALDLHKGDQLNGHLETGDLGYCDQDGFYVITGRKSRFIKLSGKRFSLDSVEGELLKLGMCACIGKDDLLVVVFEEPIEKDVVMKKLFEEYHIHHSMIKIVEVNTIPRKDSGKVLYRELTESYVT